MLKMFHSDRNGMTYLTRQTSGELVPAQLQIYPQALLRFENPFDLRSGKPEPIYDYERVKKLALTDLPRGIRYLPDFARFKDELLSDEKRTILGNDQEEWLRKNVERSVGRGASWQILGQQVLMGKLFYTK